MARVQNYTEELNENITAIEFFNQHIKHILLDESKFKTHTDKIDKLSADVTDLKDQIKKDSDKSDAMCCKICELKQLLKTDKINPIQSSQGSPEFVTSVQTSTTTAGLMQPNTTSPHHQERIIHKCDPFTTCTKKKLSHWS